MKETTIKIKYAKNGQMDLKKKKTGFVDCQSLGIIKSHRCIQQISLWYISGTILLIGKKKKKEKQWTESQGLYSQRVYIPMDKRETQKSNF